MLLDSAFEVDQLNRRCFLVKTSAPWAADPGQPSLTLIFSKTQNSQEKVQRFLALNFSTFRCAYCDEFESLSARCALDLTGTSVVPT